MNDIFSRLQNSWRFPEAQQRRLERMQTERNFLLEVSTAGADNSTLSLTVSGSTGNVYCVNIDANERTIRCNCPDFDNVAAFYGVVCKHCCFVIYRVLRSALTEDFFAPNNCDVRKFPADVDMAVYRRRVTHLSRVGLDASSCAQLTNSRYTKRLQTLKRQREAPQEEDNKTGADGADFGVCKRQDCAESQLQDFCAVCCEELQSTEENKAEQKDREKESMPEEQFVRCGECTKLLHIECAEEWIKRGKSESCVYCRAWLPFSAFLKQQEEAKSLPPKKKRVQESDYLNVA